MKHWKMLQWQLPPLPCQMKEWEGLWTLCGWAPLLCPLTLNKVLYRFQSQLIPATWKCLSCAIRAVGTVLVSPLLRFAVQAAAFDLWKSWFESSLCVRPLSPGLCWQSGLAGLYFVDNLVFKSERTSAVSSWGREGVDSGICFSWCYQDFLAIRISHGAYGSWSFPPGGSCVFSLGSVLPDFPIIFTFLWVFFHIFSYFLLSVGVSIYPNIVGRTLGKTIPYFLAFGFCLPSGDTGRVPGTRAGLREEKTGQCFFSCLKVDTRSCCTFDVAIK